MATRTQPVSQQQLFAELFKRVKSLEDLTKRRCLPAGYEFKIVTGSLTIIRTADGATETLSI